MSHRCAACFAFAMIWSILACTLLSADLIELTDGRVLEGKVVEKDDEVRVEFDTGAVTFPRSLVARIEKKKLPREEFIEREAALDLKDIAGWEGLARFCKEKKLKAELQRVLARIIEIDPGNEFARTELGHVKVGDTWLTPEEYFTSLGYVQYDGKWMTREERDLLEAVKSMKAVEQRTMAHARELLKKMDTTDFTAWQECREGLEAIEPGLKLAALIDALYTKNRELREYVLGELIAIGDVRAVPALVEIYLFDDNELSQAASDGIGRIRNADPVPMLIRALYDRESFVRFRAIAFVNKLADKRTIEPLLAALEATFRPGSTRIEQETQSGEAISAQEAVRKTGPVTDENRVVGEKIEVDIPRPAVSTRPIVPVDKERAAIRAALKKLAGFDCGYNFPLWHYLLDKVKEAQKAEDAKRETEGSKQ
jgi:hypothetical protein